MRKAKADKPATKGMLKKARKSELKNDKKRMKTIMKKRKLKKK
jgi:hypothetical protein